MVLSEVMFFRQENRRTEVSCTTVLLSKKSDTVEVYSKSLASFAPLREAFTFHKIVREAAKDRQRG